MEPDEVLEGQALFEQLKNVIKRTPGSAEAEGEEFESAEHENIGNKITLRFPKFSSCEGRHYVEVAGADRELRLRNGIKLTYGQIIALAGDFYGIPEQPIVDPSENNDKKATGLRHRFIAAYDTLAGKKYDEIKKELDQILNIMKEEKEQVEAVLESEENVAISDGNGNIRIAPKDVYDKLGHSLVEKWDKVLGGKWLFGVPVILGRMMQLAINNHDHFLPFAKDAYLAGHDLALEKAREASEAENQEAKVILLEEAYSIDAFACHFLTDSFSSGHLRVPRRELRKKVTPSKLGDLLSKFMHDEDNKFGVRVTNNRGNKWIAYGDGMLLNTESEDNLRIAVDAVQASVNHVFEIFLHSQTQCDSRVVTDYIPFVDEEEKNNTPMFQETIKRLSNGAEIQGQGPDKNEYVIYPLVCLDEEQFSLVLKNVCPPVASGHYLDVIRLYPNQQVKDGKLLRRADLANLTDPNTISDWTGVTTYYELRSYKPSGSAIEQYDDDMDITDCRSCGQSLDPELH